MKAGDPVEPVKQFPQVVVAAILQNQDGAVFVARFPKWGNRWAIPGGKVKYGETLLNALRREVREETTIEIRGAEFLRLSETICDPSFGDGTSHMILVDYLVREFSGNPVLDMRELHAFQWVTPEHAMSLELTPPTRVSIGCLLHDGSRNGQ